MGEGDSEPRSRHMLRLRVRQYEMDALGHVNNAVYLNYAEEAAVDHARRLGYDDARWRATGGTWVVRRHEIEFHAPAVAGDDLEVTTEIVRFDRVSGTRQTTVVRARDSHLLAEATTVWIWVDMNGRPRRIPPEVLEEFGGA